MHNDLLGFSIQQTKTNSRSIWKADILMSMPGVVYLASWPRSGNTLLRAILWQCFGLESCSENSEASMYERNASWHRLTGAIPFPRRMKELQQIIDEQGVALFKTHETSETLGNTPEDRTIDDDTRVIYLIRDGREACVSYWHYYREILEDQSMTLERIIRGDCLFGSWSEHVQAWIPVLRARACNPDVKNLLGLLLNYETLLTKKGSTLQLLRLFLNVSTRTNMALPDWQDFHQSDPQFFRSGTNETWKTEMTGDDLALFDELHGDMMREYGYYPAKEPAYA